MLKVIKKDTKDGPRYKASYETDEKTYKTPTGILYECPITAVSSVFSVMAESDDNDEHADKNDLCLA